MDTEITNGKIEEVYDEASIAPPLIYFKMSIVENMGIDYYRSFNSEVFQTGLFVAVDFYKPITKINTEVNEL